VLAVGWKEEKAFVRIAHSIFFCILLNRLRNETLESALGGKRTSTRTTTTTTTLQIASFQDETTSEPRQQPVNNALIASDASPVKISNENVGGSTSTEEFKIIRVGICTLACFDYFLVSFFLFSFKISFSFVIPIVLLSTSLSFCCLSFLLYHTHTHNSSIPPFIFLLFPSVCLSVCLYKL
jgi:hypothetical protein